MARSFSYKGPLVKIRSRGFNKLVVNKELRTITKTSDYAEDLRSEIRWYLQFPKRFKKYLPKMVYHKLGRNPYIILRFYNKKTLSDFFVNDVLPLGRWSEIFSEIFSLMHSFEDDKIKVTKPTFKKNIKAMYSGKTISRLNELKKGSIWKKSGLLKNSFYINNKKYSLASFKKDLERYLNSYLLEHPSHYFSLIHGDLCAGNVLYDPISKQMTLIDPRGKFGQFVIYGDKYYDLAKLSHSFLGYYDLILNNRFELYKDGNRIKYKINISRRQKEVSDLFTRRILQGYNYKKIRFIESLLFLSMIPLHSEDFNRQTVFLAHGLELFYNVIQGRI